MNKSNSEKVVGFTWVFIYVSILYKFLKHSGLDGTWGTNERLLYLNTSSTQILNRFFPNIYPIIPKIEVVKDLICIVLSILFAFSIKYSKKIFLILMVYNILDALLSCYFIKIEIDMHNNFGEGNDLYFRTLIAEYVLIFVSIATLCFLYKKRKKQALNF